MGVKVFFMGWVSEGWGGWVVGLGVVDSGLGSLVKGVGGGSIT